MDSAQAAGVRWKPITHDDVPAWQRLMDAIEDVDATGERYDADDLHEELDDPATGPDDRIAAWMDETMVAYAGVRTRGSVTQYARIDAEGGVDPRIRGRGIGSSGVAWIRQRSDEISRLRDHGFETRVRLLGVLTNEPQVRLFESTGFTAVNWSAVMRVVLNDSDASTSPVWPTGLSVHPYEQRWSTPMREAHNEAFVDHWGFVPWDAEMWQQWVDGSKNFRPEISSVVIDEAAPDRVVAYVQSNEYEAFEAATGRREAYLAKIGVRPHYRGIGLASALLRHSLAEYADHGYAESALDVDTANATGAYGLYERAGFAVELRTATYELVLPPSHSP